jgi:hypothetical protein
VEDAVKVMVVTVQVKLVGGAMLTLGVLMFCVTEAEADAVQEVDGSVTVTV